MHSVRTIERVYSKGLKTIAEAANSAYRQKQVPLIDDRSKELAGENVYNPDPGANCSAHALSF